MIIAGPDTEELTRITHTAICYDAASAQALAGSMAHESWAVDSITPVLLSANKISNNGGTNNTTYYTHNFIVVFEKYI